MVCSPAKVVSTSPWTRRCITSLINAVFGSAKDWTRDAKFTASPRTVTCASAPSWTFPTTAAPVLSPIRYCSRTPCFASSSGAATLIRCRMDRAVRQARSGASSTATGAPKTAMMPSPVKPCTTPPCSRTDHPSAWTGCASAYRQLPHPAARRRP